MAASTTVSSLESVVDIAGLALDVMEVLGAVVAEDTTLLLEFVDADGRQLGSAVVLSTEVVRLMNRDGGVDDLGLDSLLVDDRLDGLMDVVVDVLTRHCRCGSLGVRGIGDNALVLELGSLLCYSPLRLVMVAVVKLAALDGGNVVLMLLREDFPILNRLHSMVIVVLVDLLLDGGVDLFVLGRLYSLIDHGRLDLLVDGGVVVTGLVQEPANCFLSLVHDDSWWIV